MASNFTANYQLNQWEAEDAVRRVDFNADNAKIDAAIKAVDRRVDGKADTSALNGLSSRVDGLASTVSGQGSTLSSHSGSIARLGNCQVYTGTYTGDGAASKSLSFPGYPVLVRVQEVNTILSVDFLRGAERMTGSYDRVELPITWSARGLTWSSSDGQTAVPMNHSGTRYTLFALLDMSK